MLSCKCKYYVLKIRDIYISALCGAFEGGRFNPHYAIPCSAFTIHNGRANVQQWLRQAYSPPNGDIAFSPTLRFRSFPTFEGVTSPFAPLFPPLKGGGGDVPLRSDTVYPAY